MPQNVVRRMHAKYNALAQTSFESTRKHTQIMKIFFPARAASVGLSANISSAKSTFRHFMSSA